MYIKKIELNNFRNYKEIQVAFSENVNIFLGNNAQGKTNLLEAIYLNVMAKSFKNAKDKELIRFGEEYCKIKTVAFFDDDEHLTEIVINKEGKKGVKHDGVKIKKTSELLERIFMIIFSPEDLKIVKDEPEKRRRFTDRELCQIKPGYFSDLSSYKRALKQRNTYLKEDNIDASVLEIWDHELAMYGSRIIIKRASFVNKIDEISRNIHSNISGGKERLELKYEANISIDENNDSLKDIEERFFNILRESRSSDIRNRTTGRGPHKDDIKISADGIDLRKFGSQGQQRTAALSLKLSEIKLIEEEIGEKPILLLDDVLSELDSDRQSFLINSLGGNQLFITTTDISGSVARRLPEGKVYKITDGQIEIEI